jgi:hypothetical protein
MTKEEAKKMAKWLNELNASGYAGCTSTGQIVDRREHPDAIPVAANRMFGVVEPKPLPTDKKDKRE